MTSKEKTKELKEQIQEEIAYHWQGYERQEYETHKYDEDFDSIIKDLEILEILKRTKLDLWDFKHDIENFKECVSERTPYEWYSMHYMEFSREILSQEEFDLVKEWLNEKD